MPHVAQRKPPNTVRATISAYEFAGKVFHAGSCYKHSKHGEISVASVECGTATRLHLLEGFIPIRVNDRALPVWVKPEELEES